jgi:hypothetical protein
MQVRKEREYTMALIRENAWYIYYICMADPPNQAWAWEAQPDKPGRPSLKILGLDRIFCPMGGPGQQKHGPTAYLGWARLANLDDFGKAQPKSLTAQ